MRDVAAPGSGAVEERLGNVLNYPFDGNIDGESIRVA